VLIRMAFIYKTFSQVLVQGTTAFCGMRLYVKLHGLFLRDTPCQEIHSVPFLQ
jgi:hypothetical protein